MSKKYVSISIGEHVVNALEDYTKRHYQNNLSMSITYLLSQQLETIGYNIDYNNQTHNINTKKQEKIKEHTDKKNENKKIYYEEGKDYILVGDECTVVKWIGEGEPFPNLKKKK